MHQAPSEVERTRRQHQFGYPKFLSVQEQLPDSSKVEDLRIVRSGDGPRSNDEPWSVLIFKCNATWGNGEGFAVASSTRRGKKNLGIKTASWGAATYDFTHVN